MEILTGNDKDKYTISDKPKHVVPVYKGKVRNISTVTQYCSYAAYKFNSCTDTSIQWNIIKGIVFRLFVWRDMARELVQKRAWWGFSFGYPQRSRSLEVLRWAIGEWSRDGWITPHNSFFHIIYRAGLKANKADK